MSGHLKFRKIGLVIKTLNGWKILGGKADFYFEDGMIVYNTKMDIDGSYREQESNSRNEPKEKQKQGILGFSEKKVRKFLQRVFKFFVVVFNLKQVAKSPIIQIIFTLSSKSLFST